MTQIAIGTYLGLNDCKWATLSTDTAGEEATYGSLQDINIQQLNISSINRDEAELPYDETIGDIYQSGIKSIEGSIVAGTYDLDVVASMMGSTIATTGTGATAITSLGVSGDDTPVYGKLAFKSEYEPSDSSIADKHLTLCKLKVNPNFGSLQQGADGYTTFTFDFKAIPLKGEYTPATGSAIDKAIMVFDNYGAVTAIS